MDSYLPTKTFKPILRFHLFLFQMAMETAYLSSSEAFYPSTVDGDSIAHKKAMLQSCSNSARGSLRNPSGLTSDSLSPPLLFYLKDHGRCTNRLAAHRAHTRRSLGPNTGQNVTSTKVRRISSNLARKCQSIWPCNFVRNMAVAYSTCIPKCNVWFRYRR